MPKIIVGVVLFLLAAPALAGAELRVSSLADSGPGSLRRRSEMKVKSNIKAGVIYSQIASDAQPTGR